MATDFEAKVRDTGLHLFDLIKGESPSVFQKQYWTGKVLDWWVIGNRFSRLFEAFRIATVVDCVKDIFVPIS